MKTDHTSNGFMAETGGAGFITRIFNLEWNDEAEKRLEQFQAFIEAVLVKKVAGRPLIKRVDIIIPRNTSQFAAIADNGQTKPFLEKRFSNNRKIHIHELTSGDMFCSMQNHALSIQKKCNWHLFSSSESLPYWEGDAGRFVAESLVEAACKGARATGAAVKPIAESVMKGRLANTLMMWHGPSLHDVGNFNLLAAKQRPNGRGSRVLYGIKDNGNFETMMVQGVEEILPLLFMVEEHGKCLAPFSVPFEGLEYVPPLNTDRIRQWNEGKFSTKTIRQEHLAASANMNLRLLTEAVMPGYGLNT